MRIDIRTRGLTGERSLREYAAQRLQRALGRFTGELRAVTLRVADVNGPRGGVDKACRVVVHGRRIGAATVDGVSTDARAAVDETVDRVAEAIARAVARLRTLARASPASRRG